MKVCLKCFAVIIAAIILSACASRYKPPLETEPHALLKIKYSYVSSSQGTLEVWATIKEGEGKHRRVLYANPKSVEGELPLYTVLIRPGIDTEIGTWLGFYWHVQVPFTTCTKKHCYTFYQTERRQVGCKQMSKLHPQAGKIYLLNYNNIDMKDCTAEIYEQIPGADQEFELKPVD